MKKYKQTITIEKGSGKSFDAIKLAIGTKFMWNGRLYVRAADRRLSDGHVLLGICIENGDWVCHSASSGASPFVGTVTITQEEE